MDSFLNNEIKNNMFTIFDNIYLIDVLKDELLVLNYNGENFDVKENKSLTFYLEEIKNNIDEKYLSNYMNSISIPKLKEESKKGNNKIVSSYKTLNNISYTIFSMLIGNDNSNMILVLEKENNSESLQSYSNDLKYNILIDNLSDMLLKIDNVFNLDKKRISNVDSIKDYIDTLTSSLISSSSDLKKALNKTVANVTARQKDTILIVDDDQIMQKMIKKIFDDEYNIILLNNGKEAIDYLEDNERKGFNESSDHVIGIFLDLTMPVLDGFGVLDYLSKNNYLNKIPVIIISGDYEKETKSRVYNYNIADMLEKPFDMQVVKHRISNFINLYKSSNSLGNLINTQNNDLKEIIDSYVESYLYDYNNNINNISKYFNILANKVMADYDYYELSNNKIEKMISALKYYDVGFYQIPRVILSKKSNFTNEELTKIKNYPLFGRKVLNYLLKDSSDEEYKKYCFNITSYYHENYDGTGYPNGLKQNDIPIESQIAAICIYYNNLKSKKIENIDDLILSKKDNMFNKDIVNSFIKIKDEFKQI